MLNATNKFEDVYSDQFISSAELFYIVSSLSGLSGANSALDSEKEILDRVSQLAEELYKAYGDEEVVFVSVLKGSIFFAVDLAKKFKGDARIDFLRVSSYEGENSTGNINLKIALQ